MTPTDRKILNATVEHSEGLDKIIIKADAMLTPLTAMIGTISANQIERNSGNQMEPGQIRMGGVNVPIQVNQVGNHNQGTQEERVNQRAPFNGVCWTCNQQGHRSMNCPMRNQNNQQPRGPNLGYNQRGGFNGRPRGGQNGNFREPRTHMQEDMGQFNEARGNFNNYQMPRPQYYGNNQTHVPFHANTSANSNTTPSQGPNTTQPSGPTPTQVPLNSQTPL